uniref:Uncharacterized protein n=1 Tax=Cucumis melo TaxID=3656 RepID=A0A9I9DHP1_CUCME
MEKNREKKKPHKSEVEEEETRVEEKQMGGVFGKNNPRKFQGMGAKRKRKRIERIRNHNRNWKKKRFGENKRRIKGRVNTG